MGRKAVNTVCPFCGCIIRGNDSMRKSGVHNACYVRYRGGTDEQVVRAENSVRKRRSRAQWLCI